MFKKVSFKFKRKKVNIVVKECNEINKVFGLMFKRREKAEALLFTFDRGTKIKIHSFFVFFPFLAIWLDEKGRVIEVKEVKPFTFAVAPRKPYRELIEVPFNNKYRKIIGKLSK
jgi:uncharacterized membrane protein (UPF0127 family)